MPIAARYWRDPEKFRKEFTDRKHRLTKLGLSRVNQQSPQRQIKKRAYDRNYRTMHLAANRVACKRYREKFIKAGCSSSAFGRWKYKVLNARKRKAVAPLS